MQQTVCDSQNLYCATDAILTPSYFLPQAGVAMAITTKQVFHYRHPCRDCKDNLTVGV